jgi:hypothetical protein
MKTELDTQLVEKYPLIFRDRYGDMRETAMCWGIDTGDGWYQILDSLCGQIQHHIDWSVQRRDWDLKWNKENPDKEREVRNPVPQVVALQIKEKFGGLRFYYNGGDDYINGLVNMAESWAANTCETCGSVGKIRGMGWLYTACDEHTRDGDKDE